MPLASKWDVLLAPEKKENISKLRAYLTGFFNLFFPFLGAFRDFVQSEWSTRSFKEADFGKKIAKLPRMGLLGALLGTALGIALITSIPKFQAITLAIGGVGGPYIAGFFLSMMLGIVGRCLFSMWGESMINADKFSGMKKLISRYASLNMALFGMDTTKYRIKLKSEKSSIAQPKESNESHHTSDAIALKEISAHPKPEERNLRRASKSKSQFDSENSEPSQDEEPLLEKEKDSSAEESDKGLHL